MGRPSLTPDKIKKIARMFAEGRNREEIREYFKVSKVTVDRWARNKDIERERIEIASEIADAHRKVLVDSSADAIRDQYKQINEYKNLLSQSLGQSFKTVVHLMKIVNKRMETLRPEHIDAKTLPNYVRAIDSSLGTIKEAYSELLSIDDLLKELDGVKKGE